MSPKTKEAIQTYVQLLPDLYYSANDINRLLMVAYQLEINDDHFDDDFKKCFWETLSEKFDNYVENDILDFYNKRIEDVDDYLLVIRRLRKMNLLKTEKK